MPVEEIIPGEPDEQGSATRVCVLHLPGRADVSQEPDADPPLGVLWNMEYCGWRDGSGSCGYNGLLVLVKTLSCFSSKPSGGNHLCEQDRRRVFGFLGLLIQAVGYG